MHKTVKPARPGILIRLPDQPTEYLEAEGREVAWSSFWVRRVRDGDVVVVEKKARASTPRARPSED